MQAANVCQCKYDAYRSYNINDRSFLGFIFVVRARLFGYQSPQFVEVNCRTPVFLPS